MQQDLRSQVNDSEAELASLDQQLQLLNERRIALMHDIEKKKEALRNLESSISTAEVSFQKLVESSDSLIAYMKKETSEVRKFIRETRDHLKEDGNSGA
ncbi:hypothetical protein D918_06605 [Trichuris suis]|nr:hypothetical protein M513_06534 [Trichuris suis]KHJ43370.1 hypothetical protein D918_06605 [Trichuris suis]